jgi:hypothetical protein
MWPSKNQLSGLTEKTSEFKFPASAVSTVMHVTTNELGLQQFLERARRRSLIVVTTTGPLGHYNVLHFVRREIQKLTF